MSRYSACRRYLLKDQQPASYTMRPLRDKGCSRAVSIWYDPNSENEAIGIFLKFYEEHTPRPVAD